MTLQQRLLTNARNPFVLAHLVFAGMYFVFVIAGDWAKRGKEGSFDAFHSLGGAGFGILGVAVGVALCLLALMRLAGYSKVFPGLGVEQLTLALGLFAPCVAPHLEVQSHISHALGWVLIKNFHTGAQKGAAQARSQALG